MLRQQKCTILNVNDNQANRHATSRILRRAGYEVVEAVDGSETLQLLRENPDLVILNLNLPGLGGLEVGRQLKANPATALIPILQISAARCEDPAKAVSLAGGADGYLTQPVEPLVLIATVKALLRMRQAEMRLRESEHFLQSTLNALSANIAILDESGKIIAVNESWRRYAEANGLGWADYGVGVNNLEVCDSARGDWSAEAPEAAQGIRQVMANERDEFYLEYPCHSPMEQRWFMMHATRFEKDNLVRVVIAHENITKRVRAERALKDYAARLETLHKIDQAIQAARSPQEIARVALSRIRQLVPCRQASIALFDFKARQFSALAVHSNAGTRFGEGRLDPLDSFLGDIAVLRRGEAYTIEDIRALKQGSPILPGLHAEGVRALISVPIIVESNLIGALNLAKDEPAAFTFAQVEIIHDMANSLALALQNARLIEAEALQLKWVSTLLDLTRIIGSSLDPDRVMQTILDRLQQFVPYDAAAIQLLEGDTLRTAAAVGFENQSAARSFAYPLTEFPLNRQLIEGRQPIRIDDVREDARYAVIPGTEAVRAFIGVPLLVKGEPVGVITLDNYKPAQYTEHHVSTVVAIAAHAAIAIENARLFELVRTGHGRLQSLSRRLLSVQEKERRHIALELHDQIGQSLTGLKLALQMSIRESDEARRRGKLEVAQTLIDDLTMRVENMSLDLRPSLLDDLGLLPALLWHFERYTSQTNIRVRFEHRGLEGERFAAEIETAAYRIVQEALTNVARHAGVSEVIVRLWTTSARVGVQIEDMGRGFDPAAINAGESSGFAGMNERALLLGGRLTIDSIPGNGTRLTAELPRNRPLKNRSEERPL